jgi:hypothetical protein
MAHVARPRVEAVRDVRFDTRVSLTGLDLVVTSVAAFVGGWLIGYIGTLN